MMHLLTLEWQRFRCNPLNLTIVGLFFALLLLSAVWSGLAARELRFQAPLTQQTANNVAEMHDAKPVSNEKKDSAANIANNAEPLRLPALGGLVFSVRQHYFLNTNIKVSTRSRHTDGRNSDGLYNPLLQELGLLDFSVILALFLPLSLIALTYGLVQEDRESGVWRLVCTQMAKPWRLVFAALIVRYALLWFIVFVSSSIALLIDPNSSFLTLIYWILAVSIYLLIWLSVAGLFLLLPISSGAAAIGLLGVWLVLTFGIPAALTWSAEQHTPTPSRLNSIIDIRKLQEQNNQQRPELLAQWFKDHPNITAPASLDKLNREIANLPAGIVLDQHIRPLMWQFEQARQKQYKYLEHRAYLSPTLALVLVADYLAGIDAPRYAQFIAHINHFEDQWCEFFMPLLMTDSVWTESQQQQMPHFQFYNDLDSTAYWRLLSGQCAVTVLLLTLLVVLRQRFSRV